MKDQIVGTDAELLAAIEEELAKRHVAQRATGLVRLPRRSPKPEPPPEFWTQGADAMAAALEDPVAQAAARLRQMMKDRRYGAVNPHAGESDV